MRRKGEWTERVGRVHERKVGNHHTTINKINSSSNISSNGNSNNNGNSSSCVVTAAISARQAPAIAEQEQQQEQRSKNINEPVYRNDRRGPLDPPVPTDTSTLRTSERKRVE